MAGSQAIPLGQKTWESLLLLAVMMAMACSRHGWPLRSPSKQRPLGTGRVVRVQKPLGTAQEDPGSEWKCPRQYRFIMRATQR